MKDNFRHQSSRMLTMTEYIPSKLQELFTQRHSVNIPEDMTLQQYRYENLKFSKSKP